MGTTLAVLLGYAVILIAIWAFRHDLTGNQIVLTVTFVLGIGFYMGRMKLR